MRRILRKILGVAGLGINWAVIWGVLYAAIDGIVRIFRPQDLAYGEGPLRAGVTGLLAGLVSGTIFGVLVALAEDRKAINGLNVLRVALWGTIAPAVWCIINRLPTDMVLVYCVLGGVYAAVSVMLARSYGAQRFSSSFLFTVAGRSVRDPLRAACAAEDPRVQAG